ncbi:MAG: LXG domain-containing protein [Clostridiaceae bacterium]|nr:LXG domain-containing protein [Clostridiaceae bacterium]MBW4858521.1 LXG domain-containing protein [Clostridiaceae bacterium]MBW4867769.1 LXG domain-containing protein [Clostridiaceae bacterium]MBW4868041.1 LXG domain-containing protein [Clostridiaceae bacterium]
MQSVQQSILSQIANWNEQLEDISKKLIDIAEMEEMEGKTANSIRNYIYEVHITLIGCLSQLLKEYETRLILYANGYYELDADTSAKISQDELEEQMIQLENEKGEFINIDESLKKTLNSILDIISLTPPSAYRVESNYTGLYNDTRNLRATIGEYEENHFNSDFDTIEEMISGLSQIIKEQTRKEDITITNYKVGAIAKIPAYKTLLDIYTKQQSYLNESSEELTKAIANYNKLQQIIEEEMSIKQRKIEGSLQTIGGIV